ncbi:hypothetical protein PENANT_c075G04585 [Penicillium antarcticum]|uniref:Cell wall galactomannoprotein n=1 Tax=Penicillium antarcticum TaxID=416450 RepID=A0A1V6PPK0_9EURO|nr:uncharacterized protein N7508_000185 [Penicillium antarcticum]KAJ5319902.1 hypothetical protein N7508_000185 [Penicillium antarcticum]OQD78851.1 hypothetical protein PENANT_c075G04585 [Penicillium antarcticum]
MRFTLIASALALAVGTNAAMSASEVQSNIDAITQKSAETKDVAHSITVLNALNKGPLVINDFKDIITLATNDITAMNSKRSEEAALDSVAALGSQKKRQSVGYSAVEQQGICNAFRSFVEVHQDLLRVVIGKHGILSTFSFTKPIATVLQTLEGGVDKLAFGIIDTVPTCAQDATQNKNALDQTLKDAETTYSN